MTDKTDIAALRSEACEISRLFEAERFIEKVIDQLEAERQRADDRAKENYRNKCDVDNCMETIANLEAELAALKAKLANPVVLKPAYRQSEYNRLGLEPSDAYGMAWGSSATRDDCVKKILDAGFTVKGE